MDAWRGIACLVVVLCHTYGSLATKIKIPSFDFLYPISPYGALGVQLFFVISGYCIANAACSGLRKGKSIKEFVVARCRRIFPPYWISVPLHAGMMFLGYYLVTHHYFAAGKSDYLNPFKQDALFYVANATLTQEIFKQRLLNEIAWTLNYEIAFYFVCALALVFVRKAADKEAALLTGLNCLTLGILAVLMIAPKAVPFPLDLWPQFGLGVLIYDVLVFGAQGRKRILAWAIPIGMLAVAAVEAMNGHTFDGNRDSTKCWIVCWLFGGVLVLLRDKDERFQESKAWRWLQHIGMFSYTIYLVHTVIVVLAAQALAKLHFPGVLSMAGALLITAIAVAISRAFFVVMELPFMRKPAQPKASAPLAAAADDVAVTPGIPSGLAPLAPE